MGSGPSRPQELGQNEALQRFVSPESLSPMHPFWNGFLSFNWKRPRRREEWSALETPAEELLKRLSLNNLKSGNFGTLVEIFLSRQKELQASVEAESALFVWQTWNALLLLRICIKFMMENLKEDDVYRQFSAASSGSSVENDVNFSNPNSNSHVDPEKRHEALFHALIDIIIDLPKTDDTYGLHCDAVSLMVILLSTPLFSQRPSFQIRGFRIIFTSGKTSALTKTLLENYSYDMVAPASYINDGGGSVVLGIASGVWNLLTLGYNSVASQTETDAGNSKKPLSDLSILLLLILLHHCSDTSENSMRPLLFSCTNIALEKEAVEIQEETVNAKFRTDFGQLFNKLCDSLDSDESTLLLYLLLHQNKAFRSHVLASSDIEKIVVPILKTLYHAPESSNHHIYMSLIVLLILSEDDLFNNSVHDISIKNIDWYTERSLSEISLGGLLVLVVIRTIQYNMLKMRDKYLHTNCLAALANMSSQFKNLHPYVSQRIVSMFETLAKKHTRLVTVLQGSDSEGAEDSPLNEALSDKMVLEEVLRMMLEIINCCLINQFKNNSNLIYTILYKKDLFEPFLTHPAFQDLTQNLQIITAYFSSKLEQNQDSKDRNLGVHEVQEVIRQMSLQFPREKLIKFPDLKFKYVEEDQPEEFFLPYIWTLATEKIFFNMKHVKYLVQANPVKN